MQRKESAVKKNMIFLIIVSIIYLAIPSVQEYYRVPERYAPAQQEVNEDRNCDSSRLCIDAPQGMIQAGGNN